MAKRKLDFTGVDSEIKRGGGGGKHIPEGDYVVKIIEGEYHKNEDKNSVGYKWIFQVATGEHKGTKLRGYTSLKPDALWSLRNLIFAATGKNVAGKSVNFDPDSIRGKLVGAEVVDNEYTSGTGENKKTKITSQVNTCFPKEEVTSSDDDEDEDDEEEETTEEVEEDEDDDDDLEEVEVEDI